MDKRVIVSTSPSSADCTDIILRETTMSRLVFRPQLRSLSTRMRQSGLEFSE
jgi:hypothetical protein